MKNHRKFQRRHLIYYLRVFDAVTDALIGHLVDITPEGVMFINETPIDIQPGYQLKMALPETATGKSYIFFKAECKWCKKDVNPDFYVAGFQFEKIEQADKDIIFDLIENFGFEDI
jgi:hypothetical protein